MPLLRDCIHHISIGNETICILLNTGLKLRLSVKESHLGHSYCLDFDGHFLCFASGFPLGGMQILRSFNFSLCSEIVIEESHHIQPHLLSLLQIFS